MLRVSIPTISRLAIHSRKKLPFRSLRCTFVTQYTTVGAVHFRVGGEYSALLGALTMSTDLDIDDAEEEPGVCGATATVRDGLSAVLGVID